MDDEEIVCHCFDFSNRCDIVVLVGTATGVIEPKRQGVVSHASIAQWQSARL